MQQKKNRKRVVITAALIACLVAVAGLGTLAWLTAEDSETNTFMVGNFNKPTEKPGTDNGDDDDGEEEDKKPDTGNTADGFLTETAWTNNSKLVPGVPVAKNPNVGMSDGSDPAYVFIYVKNETLKNGPYTGDFEDKTAADLAPYFSIEKQWMPVTYNAKIQATSSTSDSNAYVDGLFMYVGDNTSMPSLPKALSNSDAVDNASDYYTGELFMDVTVPNESNIMGVYKTFDAGDAANDPKMTVFAYIYGADETNKPDDSDTGDGSKLGAIESAVEWAKGLGWLVVK